jgi:hypothetical protein
MMGGGSLRDFGGLITLIFEELLGGAALPNGAGEVATSSSGSGWRVGNDGNDWWSSKNSRAMSRRAKAGHGTAKKLFR